MRYAFPADILLDDEELRTTGCEAYGVTFPDVPPAITGGWSWGEALEMAEDCLGVALGMYMNDLEDIPTPSPLRDGQVLVPVPLIVAAKLTLYTAMRKQGVTEAALADRLDIRENAVRSLLNPRHRSHLSHLEKALRVVGRSLVVEDTARSQARRELINAIV